MGARKTLNGRTEWLVRNVVYSVGYPEAKLLMDVDLCVKYRGEERNGQEAVLTRSFNL